MGRVWSATEAGMGSWLEQKTTKVLDDRAVWENKQKRGRQPSQSLQLKTEISSSDLEPYRL